MLYLVNLLLHRQRTKIKMNAIKKAKDIDEDTKEFLQGLIRSYFEIAKDLVKTEVKEKFDEASKAIKSSKKTEKKITIKGDKENE